MNTCRPCRQAYYRGTGCGKRSEGGLGTGVLQVSTNLRRQPGCADGLICGRAISGVKDLHKHGGTWTRGGGSLGGGDDGRDGVCLLRELRDGISILQVYQAGERGGSRVIGEKWPNMCAQRNNGPSNVSL